jgi:hypothetical protein
MAEITLETLKDGTPITVKLVDKMVADVYASLEKGEYEVMPNPHRSRKPVKTAESQFRLEIAEILAET